VAEVQKVPSRAPRRRKSAHDLLVEEAARFAAMLADAPADGDDPLARLGCLTSGDRMAFALLCVYTAEFVLANDELLRKGFVQRVPSVSGGVMLRDNPALRRRDTAAGMIMELSARFGMTPLDCHKLFGAKARAPEVDGLDGGLFDQPAAAAARAPAIDTDAPAPPPTRWDQLLGPRAKPN
jgi:hypothetical protein